MVWKWMYRFCYELMEWIEEYSKEVRFGSSEMVNLEIKRNRFDGDGYPILYFPPPSVPYQLTNQQQAELQS